MKQPPRSLIRFLRWFCREDYIDEIEGDLIEVFHKEPRFANWKFAWLVIRYLRPEFIKSFRRAPSNSMSMYTSYFKIAWRNILRKKGYSLINISGLTAGLTITLLIGLWVYDELSFNRHHDHYSTIAQVYRKETRGDQTMASIFQTTGLGAQLATEYPSYFDRVVMMNTRTQERTLAYQGRKFTQVGYFMQATGVSMFSLDLIAGSGAELTNKNTVLLSESAAQKIFGDQDPIGQVLTLDGQTELNVAAIYRDLPGNSELHDATFFAPLELYTANTNTWDNYNVRIYVQLDPTKSTDEASSLIRDITRPHIPNDRKQEIFLLPMSDWHFHSEFENGVTVTSQKLMAVWYYALIGVFVLVLACINFMNLSTARSVHRAKEVGIRKAIGSQRGQLIHQFYSESFLLATLSFVAALLLSFLLLPWFNSIAGKSISLPWQYPLFWLAGIGCILITGLLAGSYPALYLSSFRPVEVLKGKLRTSRFAISARKSLVVMQFTISIALTAGTIVVYQQIQYAKERPVGYSRENLVGLRANSPEYRGKYDVLRQELKATGKVYEMAESDYSVTETLGSNDGFSWNGQEYTQSFNTIRVTPEYGKTVGWEFIAGRDFSRDIASDTSGIVINESAAKVLGIANPVGEYLQYDNDQNGPYRILGVVKDMVKGSPFQPTEPSIIFYSKRDLFWLYMRLEANAHPQEALREIANVFARLVPSASFDFRFIDEEYDAKFRSEDRIGVLGSVFSSLTILISCLGLIGLAAFTAESRTKEIGIRKVNGASVMNLWKLLSTEFLVLVIVSCALALPASYYVMERWLVQYEYKIGISPWMLVATAVGAVALTLLTVSYHSLKAALASPVKSLRSE